MRTVKWTAIAFRVAGLVQGVGFRPFVVRLARELGVSGWVRNDSRGVTVHSEGAAEDLAAFEKRLRAGPAGADTLSVTAEDVPPTGCDEFRVVASRGGEPVEGLRVPPDRAICSACRADVGNAADRRFEYPFTTCTDCGPRYSILDRLPYDRATTSMERFPLCADCRSEYEDPDCRRFHAEPIACPACGPRVALLHADGTRLAENEEAIHSAAERLRQGRIVALKGLGGYQLLVRADSPDAVARLRLRKARPAKPLAVMVPSLDQARRLGRVGPTEAALLTSPENPIVLLEQLGESRLAPEVNAGLRRVGVMLPTTPLHVLLLAELGFPVVATSGNRGEEPIVTDEAGALEALASIADVFLVHDRPIRHRVDDSVVAVIGGAPVAVRLARGYCPLPLPGLERWAKALGISTAAVLATGGQQKIAPALWAGGQAILGPHVGDLDSVATRQAFRQTVENLASLYQCSFAAVACDLHPDYVTTRWAEASGLPLVKVQHHHAHAAAAMAEHDLLDREVLALTWDGTGYGTDGTIWGGEALRTTASGMERVASLRTFPLAGGEAAVNRPNRVALALLAETLGYDTLLKDAELLAGLGFSERTAGALLRMAERGLNTPWTSSMGRLFDAAAALILGIREVSFEGEAAALLEATADEGERGAYPLPGGDWRPLVHALLTDIRGTVAPPATCAARFHNALAGWAAAVAEQCSLPDVVLTGGCFVNALLSERVAKAVGRLGRRVHRHSRVPPNDGGLAVGQLAVALAGRAGVP